jgi:TatA/E family protein of Tat protein translocase
MTINYCANCLKKESVMGFHGISLGSLLLTLIIAVLVFGTKRLRDVGEDLGVAMRNFRKGLQGEDLNSKSVDPVQPINLNNEEQ